MEVNFEKGVNFKNIKKRSQLKAIWFRFSKNKLAMFGLILFAITIIFTVGAPVFISYDAAIEQNISKKLISPGKEYIFGTDMYGRDMFARVIYGGRISLLVGLSTVIISLFFGSLIGSLAAYYGGRIDNILMRIMDVFLAIPSILMAIAVVAALGQGIVNILIAMSMSRIPQFARIVRSAILSIKGQEFIEAAKA
ncbi:MAG TPA: ABC transporter permease, partial [Clostridiaceae bacterium]|nr:ABC transporter permease [Clostridiaceae bacterium]